MKARFKTLVQISVISGTVTTAWRVLRCRIEDRLPIWRIAANTLNKQPRKADKGCFSSLRGEVLKILTLKLAMLQTIPKDPGLCLILWHDVRNGKETWDSAHETWEACMGQSHLRQWIGNKRSIDEIQWMYKRLCGTKKALFKQGIILFSIGRKLISSVRSRIFCTPENSVNS